MIEIKVKRNGGGLKIPKYATEKSSCFDLYAGEDAIIKPGETVVINTKVILEPPDGYGIMLYPRSGISSKTPLRFANSVGVIDNDYRGEIKILMENIKPKDIKQRVVPEYINVDGEVIKNNHAYGFLPQDTVVIKKGDRIAQAMPIPIEQATLKTVKEVSTTKRGEGGLGSTGTK